MEAPRLDDSDEELFQSKAASKAKSTAAEELFGDEDVSLFILLDQKLNIPFFLCSMLFKTCLLSMYSWRLPVDVTYWGRALAISL